MFEKELFNICLGHLTRLPAVKGVKNHRPEMLDDSFRHDAIADIVTDQGPIRVIIETKRTLTRAALGHLFMLGKNASDPLIVFSEHVNSVFDVEMKTKGLNYVDRPGNIHLNLPGIYVDVRGNKRVKIVGRERTALFQSKGMQLLFILLTDTTALNEPVRALMKKSGIAFERTAAAMKELKEKGYIFETKDGLRRWARKREAFDKWLDCYSDRLRPKLVLGSYKMPPSAMDDVPALIERALANETGAYALGGGLAGDLLDHHYRGPSTEIFIRPERVEHAVHALNLMPGQDPDVTFFNLFSPSVIYRSTEIVHPIAHPLLIYAELLHQGGDRAEEAAGRIYDRYLKQDFDAS